MKRSLRERRFMANILRKRQLRKLSGMRPQAIYKRRFTLFVWGKNHFITLVLKKAEHAIVVLARY